MANNINKKLFAGIFALSAGFVLAACDPVSAVPSNYNNPIVSAGGEAIDLDGNSLGTLYDAITTERNEKIVNDILSDIAIKKFGSYDEFKNACALTAMRDSFIEAHKEFFGTENAVERFNAFKEDIEDRISEYFYNEITSGTYNDDLGRFDEKKLYNAHKYELYDLEEVSEDSFKPFFVDKELTKKNAFSKLYQNGKAYTVTDAGKRGYIQEKVYPDILRNKLVENYIYENNPSSLGRAYGRELSYIKLSYEGEPLFMDSLTKNFALQQIQVAGEHAKFELLENAAKGFHPSTYKNADEGKLVLPLNAEEDALFAGLVTKTPITLTQADVDEYYTYSGYELVSAGSYYVETKLGSILESYQKAIDAEKAGRFPAPELETALESFTSDGKSKEYGLLQKLISLMKEDYTTEGWFVKNGGVTELPSDIRDRLFNIRVANDFDSLVKENGTDAQLGDYEFKFENGVKTTTKLTRLPYLRNVYGKKLVLPANSLSFDKDNLNYVYHDVDGKAFYICEVYEAPSTAKLNKNETTVYDGVEDQPILKENISRQIAKILGTKDSYIKDAYTQELNKYEFTFFDTSLYDYLKSEYPDLDQFDED